MVRVNQMIHNMEDHHRRELEVVKVSARKAYRRELLMIVLVFLSLITAVGIPLLSQVISQEKSLMTLKQEVDSKFAILTKEADQSLMKMKQEFYSMYSSTGIFTWHGTLFTGSEAQ